MSVSALSTGSYWLLSSSRCGSSLAAPSRFTIVEEGAEDGQLAIDILSAITEESIEAAACIRYIILEPIPGKAAATAGTLGARLSRKSDMADRVK